MFRYVLLFTFAITVTLEPVFKINGKYFLTKILRKQQTNLARLQQIKKKPIVKVSKSYIEPKLFETKKLGWTF